jgi:hypothetical protein
MFFFRKQQTGIMVLMFSLLLYGCIHTESGNRSFNRSFLIKAMSGNIHINISGHISENIYFDNPITSDFSKQQVVPDNRRDSPIVSQGKETINQNFILYENQEYKYTLTTAEIVIITVRSLDENNAILKVFERGVEKEYKIDAKNKLGQTIILKN